MEFYNSYAYENDGQELRIYLPGGDGWFQYTLRHIVKPYTDGGTYQNQDLWRLHNLYLCRKTSDGFERIYDFPLTTAGEWECAVKIEGTPDFHGGFHGYEHLTDFTVTPHTDRLEIVQNSNLYLQGTRDQQIARHRKHYVFRDGVLTLDQTLLWNIDADINRAFVPMLPIRRKEEDFLITDTAIDGDARFDISTEGHKTPLSPGCQQVRHTLTVAGQQSGITASVTVETPLNCFIQNTKEYNKLYFYMAKGSPVHKGDQWNSHAVFRLSYNRPVQP